MARRSSKRAPGSAYDAGLRIIASRDHSRWELRQKLIKRGYVDPEVAAAEARLLELGLLGDQRFARQYVRRRARAYGPAVIASELAARRVDRDTAQTALAGLGSDEQMFAAGRLAGRLAGNTRFASYRELLSYVGSKLLRRGFSMDVARAACRDVWQGTPQEAEA